LTRYLDTSVIVASLTREVRTDAAHSLLAKHGDELAISPWVVTETSAALSIKCRIGQISSSDRNHAIALFRRLAGTAFAMLEIGPADFQAAAELADRHDTGLRAGDALHLAIAARHGARLHTLDRDLAKAARALGVAAVLV
jgi:predicted nucleic acid-binding protein